MRNLITAELLRMWSRGLVIAAVATMIGLSALIAIPTGIETHPVSTAERAEADSWYQQDLADWKDECPDEAADCMDFKPLPSDYLREPLTTAEAMDVLQSGRGGLVTLLCLVAAASFVAAEFRSGSISTWVMFNPRRSAVYVAKLAAAAVSVAAASAISCAVAIGTFAVTVMAGGSRLELPDTPARLGLNLAGGLVVAAVGVALATLTRHTIAVVGIALGVGVLELVTMLVALSSFSLSSVVRWLPSSQLDAVFSNGTIIESMDLFSDGPAVSIVITPAEGLTYWTILAAIVTAIAVSTFRRTDLI